MKLVKKCAHICDQNGLLIEDDVEYFYLSSSLGMLIIVTNSKTHHIETRCPVCDYHSEIMAEDSAFDKSDMKGGETLGNDKA